MKTETITTGDGLSLSCSLAGADTDTGLVFLHGILQAGLCFKHQLSDPALTSWRLAAPDLRGHGFSSKPSGSAAYHDDALWADDVMRVIAAAGLTRAILVGWSYGGRVILDTLAQRGNDPRIAGLVFVNANTKAAPGHISPASAEALTRCLDPDMARNLAGRAEFVSLCFEQPPGAGDLSEILAYNSITTPEILRGLMGRPMERDDIMARVAVPTLVVHGARDRLCLPVCGRHTAATIPGARLIEPELLGHSPHFESPDWFNRTLGSFAAEVFGDQDGRVAKGSR